MFMTSFLEDVEQAWRLSVSPTEEDPPREGQGCEAGGFCSKVAPGS